MTNPRTQHEVSDLHWRMERDLAESVSCRECGQPAGHTCINVRTGKPKARFPACGKRIHDALEEAGK